MSDNNFMDDRIGRPVRAILDVLSDPPSRDQLAAMAMQGAMANPDVLARLEEPGEAEVFARNVAGLSYNIADAMIEARGAAKGEG